MNAADPAANLADGTIDTAVGAACVDVLIVGQGMAGSVLAYTLMEAGFCVCVVDDGHKTSASAVAAGMIAPVLGQRLSKAWEIEKCLPLALGLYGRMEAHLRKRFFFPRRILRLIDSEQEAELLQKRLTDAAFLPYLGPLYPPAGANRDGDAAGTVEKNEPAAALRIGDEFGSIAITGGGYLGTCGLLAALREYFVQQGSLTEARFDHTELDLGTAGAVRWRHISAKRIIFAEGWRILHNPLFAAYDFQPTRGQILTVQAAQPLPADILSRSKWLIPQSGQQAWIGATYERGKTEITNTAKGRREILAKVQSFLPDNPLMVVGERAGIRLSCRDFIPRAGFLPDDPRIGVFNAFSSKVNCFAPFLAKCMAEHLRHGTPLPQQADIGQKKTRAEQHR